MTFVNPVGHIPAPAIEAPRVLRLAGKDVPFRELGAPAILMLAERFPELRERLSGEDVEIAEGNAEPFALAVIALAVAADGTTIDELGIIEESLRGLKALERDMALATIMAITMPAGMETDADFPKAPKKPAARGTRKKPARKAGATKA